MKKIILLLTLAGLSCFAAQQVTDLTLITPVVSNAAHVGTMTIGGTEYTAEGVDETLESPFAEICVPHTNAQSFAGSSWEVIDIFADNIVSTNYFTTTSSNITVASAGLYEINFTISFETDTASLLTCRIYDNGNAITNAAGGVLGFKRKQGASLSSGVAGTHGYVNLSSNAVLSVKMYFEAAEEVTYDSCVLTVEKE